MPCSGYCGRHSWPMAKCGRTRGKGEVKEVNFIFFLVFVFIILQSDFEVDLYFEVELYSRTRDPLCNLVT